MKQAGNVGLRIGLAAIVMTAAWPLPGRAADGDAPAAALILDDGVAPHAGLDRIYERFTGAYRDYDAGVMADLYAEDALYLSPRSDVRRGREAIREGFARMFERARERHEMLHISFRILRRDVSGTLATDVGIFTLVREVEGEPARDGAGKFVVVARREDDGVWRFQVDTYNDLDPDRRGAAAPPRGDGAKRMVAGAIEERLDRYAAVARSIWELAEVGYQEVESSALLQAQLEDAGFRVEAGAAGIPTAFVASQGRGRPVIGLLAEFDALPGLSQRDVPRRRPIDGARAGHACGHHLLGTASVAAGIALGDWLETSGTRGTVRVYGTPAEEGGAGKVYLKRAGLFDDVDAVLAWHPDDRNAAGPQTSLAVKSAKFRFHGVSAHAAAAPERGRSALDAVEAMNDMVNLLREHVTDGTRIHYVITSGGGAPNVVPDYAEVYYYVRHPDPTVLSELFERVVAAAEGAARGTGTRLDYEVIHGAHSVLPNETLSGLLDANLRRVGGVVYDAAERAFAREIRATFERTDIELGSEAEIQPFAAETVMGSTDVGDLSWDVPTAQLRTATWVPGTAAHSWQAVAAGGTGIGIKGMSVAARTLAMTAVDLYTAPGIVAAARAELEERRGPDYEYVPLLGDRAPPLDYRR